MLEPSRHNVVEDASAFVTAGPQLDYRFSFGLPPPQTLPLRVTRRSIRLTGAIALEIFEGIALAVSLFARQPKRLRSR